MYNIYVIPDTNVLRNKMENFIEKLKPFKDYIIVGIPQIPIDETIKSLYRLACGDEGERDEFLYKLVEITIKLSEKGFCINIIPIAAIINVSRLDLCYIPDKECKEVLSEAISQYVGRGKRYYPALKQILNRAKELVEKGKCKLRERDKLNIIDPEESPKDAFQLALTLCCECKGVFEKQLMEQCRVLYGVLGDVLLISSFYRILRFRNKPVVGVTEESEEEGKLPVVAKNVLKRFGNFYISNLCSLSEVLKQVIRNYDEI